MKSVTSIIETQEFKLWYGESMLVDATGLPITLYHGTTRDISAFEAGRGTEKDAGWYGRGIYLTADPHTASAYSGYEELQGKPLSGSPNVLPLYANLQNPYIWVDGDAAFTDPDAAASFTDWLISIGHDGVVVPNKFAEPGTVGDFYEVVVFDPRQIKSAIGNSGRFDPESPDLCDQECGRPMRRLSP